MRLIKYAYSLVDTFQVKSFEVLIRYYILSSNKNMLLLLSIVVLNEKVVTIIIIAMHFENSFLSIFFFLKIDVGYRIGCGESISKVDALRFLDSECSHWPKFAEQL
jgi:hypothetical protein